MEAKEIISSLSTIIKKFVDEGDTYDKVNNMTLLFNEAKYKNKTWNVIMYSGFFTTIPMIRYHNVRKKYKIHIPEIGDISELITKIFKTVKPPLECLVVSFLYIEKLIVLSILIYSMLELY